MARKLYLILDTETVTADRRVIDLGYRLVDRKGEVYDTGSYLITDFFADAEGVALMVGDRFTKGKVPRYVSAVMGGTGEFELADFAAVRETVNALVAEHDPVLVAYNVRFDLDALDKTARALLGADFFEQVPEVLDLWAAAMSTVCRAARYVRFIAEHGILTEGGNPQTGAEAVYRFITDDPDFEEAHTAAADCEVEAAIFAACLRTKKRMNREPVGMCLHNPDWRSVVERYRSLVG